MKFLKYILLMALTLNVLADGPTADFSGASFLGTTKQITINTNLTPAAINTYNYGYTNIFYVNGSLIGAYSWTTNYLQPTIDANGFYWYTNTLVAYSSTNASAGGTNQSSIVAGSPWIDVPNLSDVNGNNASAAIGVSIIGLNASCTNVLTFTLTPSVGLSYLNMGALSFGGLVGPLASPTRMFSTQNPFSFSVTANGLTPVNILTNIPTSVLQGAGHLRIASIAIQTNGAGNGGTVFIQSLNLRGYRP